MAREALIAEIDCIRRQGYSISDGEQVLGTFSIVTPVIYAGGAVIAAASVAGSTDRLKPKRIELLSIEVRAIARGIAERYDGGWCG